MAGGYDSMWQVLGQVSIAADSHVALAAVNFQTKLTFQHKDEALRRSRSKFTAGFEFGCVLHKSRAQCRARMHNSCALLHARQCGANESIRRQKQMVMLLGASRLTESMHGTSFFVNQQNLQADRASAIRIRVLLPHLPSLPIPPGRG